MEKFPASSFVSQLGMACELTLTRLMTHPVDDEPEGCRFIFFRSLVGFLRSRHLLNRIFLESKRFVENN